MKFGEPEAPTQERRIERHSEAPALHLGVIGKEIEMKNQRGFTLVEGAWIFFVLLALAGAVGWVWNIIKLIAIAGGDISAMFVLRIIGVFLAPLGSILGFF